MPKYVKPGVYSTQINYYKQSFTDFVNSYNAGYKRTSKLRAKWTMESRAQLKFIYGLDAEQELTKALADQIRNNIDKEIMRNLTKVCV